MMVFDKRDPSREGQIIAFINHQDQQVAHVDDHGIGTEVSDSDSQFTHDPVTKYLIMWKQRVGWGNGFGSIISCAFTSGRKAS